MGLKAEEEFSLSADELENYLRSNTRVFMKLDGHEYYITRTDQYWRVQDCEKLNDKGRFTDCSDLVDLLREFMDLAWIDGKTLKDVAENATYSESIQEGWVMPTVA